MKKNINSVIVAIIFSILFISMASSVYAVATVDIEPSEPNVYNDLTCSYSGSATVTSYKWYRNGGTTPYKQGQNSNKIYASETSEGQSWKCEVYLYNPYGSDFKAGEDTVQIGEPPQGKVDITPDNPTSSQTLTCTFSGTATVSKYKWYKNGNPVKEGQSNNKVYPSETNPNDVWKCEVYLYNPYGSDFKIGEDSVTILYPVVLESISISPTSSAINMGASQAYTVTALYSDSSTADVTSSVTFTSSNTVIANEISHAVFKALSPGTATITASYGGKTAQATLVVNPPGKVLDRIEINPTSSTIYIGNSQAYTVTAYYTDSYYSPEDVTSSATFTSSNYAIASPYMANNNFKGNSGGTATITASYGGKTAQATLNVLGPSLYVNPTTVDFGSVTKGYAGSKSFNIKNTGTGTLTWSLSESCSWVTLNPATGSTTTETDSVQVSINTTTLSTGLQTCQIKADPNYGSDQYVTVKVDVKASTQPPVAKAGSDVDVTDNDGNGYEFVMLDGSGSYDPDGGSIVSYIWKENSVTVGFGVNPNIKFDVGTHDVTLTVTDDEAETGTDTVTVTVHAQAKTLKSISISPKDPTINVGDTQQFTITANYSDSSTADVTALTTCYSGNPTVASQTSNNCEFIGNDEGVAFISAEYKEGSTKLTGTVLTVVIDNFNDPPIIENIPDATIQVGQTISAIDLWAYASDPEDLKDAMTYTIVSESNTAVIDCYISSNRYVVCYNSQQVGYSDITVRVTDSGSPTGTPKSDTDSFRITVEQAAFNNPPTISGIPDKSVQVGSTISNIDLYNYASDNEDPDSALTYEIASQSNSGAINCYIHNSHYVKCDNAAGTGSNTITVKVTDTGSPTGTPKSDTDDFVITVTSAPFNNPPTISGIPDKSVQVGSTISNIDLYNYANDNEDSDNQMTYTIVSESNTAVIDCYISSNRYVVCYNSQQVGYSDITVRVTDSGSPTGTPKSDTDSFRITVTSGPPVEHDPVIDSMSLTPSSPTTNQDLTCDVSVSDADGDLNHVEFKWYVEDMNSPVKVVDKTVSGNSDSASDILSHTYTDYNDEVRCKARVYDAGSRNVASSRTVTVQSEPGTNTPPVIAGIPDKSVQIGNTINQIDLYNYANDVEDSDSALTYIITSETNTGVIDCSISGDRYVVCGNGLSVGYSDITVKVIDTGALFDTDTFRITVTSAPVENDPVIETLEITPSNPVTDDDLECTVLASDDDGDLDRAVFKWYRNGVQVGSSITKTLSGYLDTESVTLSSSSTSPTDMIRCDVTVYDDNSNTDSDTESVIIQSVPSDNPPFIDSLAIHPQAPTTDNDLTCMLSAHDIDGDLNSVEFKWYRNGVQVGSTETKTLSGYYDFDISSLSHSYTSVGDLIQCRTVVYDDNDNSVMFSASVIVESEEPPENDPPVSEAEITPVSPTTSQDLTCRGTGEDTDGNLYRMVFEWTIPNRYGSTVIKSTSKTIAGGFDIEQDTLASSYTQEGDLVTCRVVTYDDEGLYGSDSASVYVQTSQPGNQPPIAVMYAYPTSIYEADQVLFDADSSYDIDGSVASYYFDFGDGTNSGWTSSDHVYHTYATYGTYYARTKVRDDQSLESAWSSTIPIVVRRESEPPAGDHDPIIDNIYISPSDPEEYEDIECRVSAYDSDGDINRIVIKWYVEGHQERTRTYYDSGSRATVSDVLDESYFVYDDTVRCEATVYDDDENSDDDSFTVIIGYEPYYPPYTPPCPTCTPPATGTCGISISGFDFSQNSAANKLSWTEVEVLNTGTSTANLELKVLVDGSVKGIYRDSMSSGSKIKKHFDFGLEEGSHSLNVQAKMDCGSTDSESATIYVGEPSAGFAGEEYVDIYPKEVRMDVQTTSEIYININSPSQQRFTISAGGMEDSWLHYDNDIDFQGIRTEKIMLTPKNAGTFIVNVVVSSESGKTFRKDVKVYVNDYSQVSDGLMPLAGAAGAVLTGNYLAGLSSWGIGNIVMAIITLLLLIVIIYLLYKKFRTEDYNGRPQYSPETAEIASENGQRYASENLY